MLIDINPVRYLLSLLNEFISDIITKQFNSQYASRNTCTYSDIFSEDINKQKEVTHLYVKLFEIREMILESNIAPTQAPIQRC